MPRQFVSKSALGPVPVRRSAVPSSIIAIPRTRPQQSQLPLTTTELIRKPDVARRQAAPTANTVHHHQPQKSQANPPRTSKPIAASRQAALNDKSTVKPAKPDPQPARRPITTIAAATTRTARSPHAILMEGVQKCRAVAESADAIDADNCLRQLKLKLAAQRMHTIEKQKAEEEEMKGRMKELRNRLQILREWKEGEAEREARRLQVIANNKRREEEAAAAEEEEDGDSTLAYYGELNRKYAVLREKDLAAFEETEEYRREVIAFADFSGVWC